MQPASPLLEAEPRISRKDLERNRRFTKNLLSLLDSYDADKTREG